MAGLPCDTCGEPSSIVIGTGADGEDAAGNLVYRRYRTCTNASCQNYLLRRTTLEFYPEDQGEKKYYSPSDLQKIQRAISKENEG